MECNGCIEGCTEFERGIDRTLGEGFCNPRRDYMRGRPEAALSAFPDHQPPPLLHSGGDIGENIATAQEDALPKPHDWQFPGL